MISNNPLISILQIKKFIINYKLLMKKEYIWILNKEIPEIKNLKKKELFKELLLKFRI